MNLLAWKNHQVICPQAPWTLFIEPTNHCNLKCVFCPQKDQKRSLGFMKEEVYSTIIQDAASCGVKKINLFFLGESLLHKSLFFMIEEAKKLKLQVRLNTNATFLDEEKAEKILKSKLDFLTISFDGVNKKIYENLRRGAKYESTMKNIEFFLRSRIQGQSPMVSIEVIEMAETRMLLSDFCKRMENLSPDQITIKNYRNWTGYLQALTPLDRLSKYTICSYPWRSMAVLFDGRFVPCCVDYDGKYTLGTFEEGIMNIWNGEKMRSLRQYLIHRKQSLEENFGLSQCHSLCSFCDIPFQKEEHCL